MTQFERSVNHCVFSYNMTAKAARKIHKKCFVSFIGLPNVFQMINLLRWELKGVKVDWGGVSRMCIINGKWFNMRSEDVKYMKLGECMIDEYALDQVEGFLPGTGAGDTLRDQNDLYSARYLDSQKNVVRIL